MIINHTLAPTPTPTHTPGPWYAKGRYILSDPLHPSIACATVLKAPSLALEPQFEAQAHANARLLAAAPDMLAALVLLVDGDGKPDECPRAMAAARAALLKARGDE